LSSNGQSCRSTSSIGKRPTHGSGSPSTKFCFGKMGVFFSNSSGVRTRHACTHEAWTVVVS
jgi:hypothetical protein